MEQCARGTLYRMDRPRRRKRSALAFLGGMLLLMAIALIGAAPQMLESRMAQDTATATGQVVRLLKVDDRPFGGSWHAMVCFQDMQGRMITFTDRTGANPPLHRVGDAVQVAYNPFSATDAILPEDLRREENVGRIIGIVFATLGAAVLFLAWRLRRGNAAGSTK